MAAFLNLLVRVSLYTTRKNDPMTSKTILTGLAVAGCLLLGIAPLLLILFVAIQGNPYYKSIITPGDTTWSFNPFYNVWPVSLLLGLIIAVLFTLDMSGGRGFRSKAQNLGQGFLGGCLVAAAGLSLMVYLGAWVNARWDSGLPEQHQAQVLDKVIERHKFGASYYLVVPDWRDPEETPVLVYLGDNQQGYDLSQRTEVLTPVSISTGGGFLGLDWVIAVEPAPGSG